MKIKTLLLLLSVLFGVTSCLKKDDSEAPLIASFYLNGLTSTVDTVQAGDTLLVIWSLTDNESLKQAVLNVHPADDGHGHETLAGDTVQVPNSGIWTFSKTFDCTGRYTLLSHTLYVPDTIQGLWHVEIQAVDEKGNAAEEYAVELVVQ